jgi:hypothetical protein
MPPVNHVLSGPAADPALPSEPVDRLIAVADAALAIAEGVPGDRPHPNATAPVLLSCLADDRARPVAAAHPALPPRVIVELLSDPDRQVAEAAAGNPSLPPAVMTHLVTGIDEPFTNGG